MFLIINSLISGLSKSTRPDFSGGFRHVAADLSHQPADHNREGSLTSALWNGFMQLSTQPQPIAGERPGEDVTDVEAIPLSQQQHPVIASLQTGEGLCQHYVSQML